PGWRSFFSSLFCYALFQSRKFCGTFFISAIDFCLQDSKLLTGDEESVYGDSGYLGADKREDSIRRNRQGRRIRYRINRRPSQIRKKPTRAQGQLKRREHEKSSIRA
ncbi:hypothetical protein ACTNBU_12810, partial [Dysosmobacter sp. HCP28S3_G4]